MAKGGKPSRRIEPGTEEVKVDFSKPSRGLCPPVFPSEHAVPADDDAASAGSDFWVWDLTIDAADHTRRAASHPMSVQPPGVDTGTSLAAKLNWKIPKNVKQIPT